MSCISNREDIYDLLGYIVTSAKELVVDPKLYGPLRLVDTASRLIGLLEKEKVADQFMLSLKDYIDENKFLLISDEEQFKSFLAELVEKLALFTSECEEKEV